MNSILIQASKPNGSYLTAVILPAGQDIALVYWHSAKQRWRIVMALGETLEFENSTGQTFTADENAQPILSMLFGENKKSRWMVRVFTPFELDPQELVELSAKRMPNTLLTRIANFKPTKSQR